MLRSPPPYPLIVSLLIRSEGGGRLCVSHTITHPEGCLSHIDHATHTHIVRVPYYTMHFPLIDTGGSPRNSEEG